MNTIEIQGEYSEEEKQECYDAAEKIKALIEELNL
jgi:hypothetical protein